MSPGPLLQIYVHAKQAAVMRLMHLGLPVRDTQRSRRFYETYFGFDPATAQSYPDGTVIIRNADGFDLALHGDQQFTPLPAFLHCGFRLPDHNDVRTKLAQLRAAGIEITEHHDEPRYVAFKCADPDGYQVELYWEPA